MAFLGELESAPVPHFSSSDSALFLEAFGVVLGASGGGEKVRLAATAGFGAVYWRLDARLTITPWMDAKGHRHGMELGAAWNIVYASFAASYRIVFGLRKLRQRRDARRRSSP